MIHLILFKGLKMIVGTEYMNDVHQQLELHDDIE